MLISALFAQSDCNKDNWQEYYNSEGRDMTECDLSEANLTRANLEGVISSVIRGVPDNLPEGWSLVDGTLLHCMFNELRWTGRGDKKRYTNNGDTSSRRLFCL